MARTTSAQLRAATARGAISASNEKGDIARAQRERNAVQYYAEDSIRAGNDAAAVKRYNLGCSIDHDADVSSSITNTQLRAATVRGAMSASEEKDDIARAQRERDAVQYYAEDSVQAGKDAAAFKRNDLGHWTDHDADSLYLIKKTPPHLQKLKMESQGSINSSRTNSRLARSMPKPQSKMMSRVNDDKNVGNGSKMRMHQNALKSVRNTFSARSMKKMSKQESTLQGDSDVHSCFV